jgi:hypothetical protein
VSNKQRYEAVLELSGWCIWDNKTQQFVAGFFNEGKVFVQRLMREFDCAEDAANVLTQFLNTTAKTVGEEE